LVAVLLGTSVALRAEHLPIKSYSSADGLPHDEVERIVPDSRGFLWFCTRAGLSRFDGYTFVNFGSDQGLPEGRVNDLLETRTHEYWVATDGGLVRFDPAGQPARNGVATSNAGAPPMFVLIAPAVDDRFTRTITVLREGRDGTLWVGTRKGLYRLVGDRDARTLIAVDIGLPHDIVEDSEIADIQEDRFHTLWIAAPGGLYRRWPDGSSARYAERDGLPSTYLTGVTEDREGRFWVGTRQTGFFGFTADATHAKPKIGQAFGMEDGLPNTWVTQIFEASDGRLWIADAQGLVEFFPNGAPQAPTFHAYGQRNGLTHYFIRSMSEDHAGNLWLASGDAGVVKVVHDGFTTYGRLDGLSNVNAILEDRAGNLCFRGYVLGDDHSTVFDGGTLDLLGPEPLLHTRVGCFDGARFSAFMPEEITSWGWVLERTTLETRSGEFWLGTDQGVFRYAATDRFSDLKTTRPRTVYTMRDGLAGSQVYRLFEDSRGNIWIATTSEWTNGLARWDATSERIVDVDRAPNLPSPREQIATSFGEDTSGNVWIGFSNGLARYAGGTFAFFAAKDGLPPGAILDIHEDRAGRLWLASDRAGLMRVDNGDTRHPTFVRYADAEGRPGTNTFVIVEDSAGFLYFGGGQGIDRLDPATGRVKHFTAADGLTPGLVQVGYQDRRGVLWFGSTTGLARLEPTRKSSVAPATLISAVRVNGVSQVVSALGERVMMLGDVAPNENHLEVDFLALEFGAGEVLRYQYKLEGSRTDWSAPSLQRTVNFANLASGRYTFLVRAINSDGLVSEPASVRFAILRPVWLRSWFLGLAALSAGALLFSVHRYRLRRVLELAAIRTGIATDLHDDIGANLTRISMLSEAAKRGVDATALTAIDGIARESVSAMSDIVWAINPERESLGDLIRRMRAHGEEIFTRREIDFRFTAPDTHDTLRLGVDTRRDLLLIFKEAVNNTARHSHCSSVTVDFQRTGAKLTLSVADNGVGFDTSRESTGQGLASLRRRATRLGGTLEVRSAPSGGTTVTLRVPLRRAAYQGR
jgi:ligand-binding sensor domain-containing protein/two-component sensor histidine kinase